MKKYKLAAMCVTLISLIIMTSFQIFATELPEPTDDFYVLDESNILETDTKNYIIEQNNLLYDATGAQIVVITEDFVEDGKLELYAYNIFNKWEIGSKDKNNGILLLISIGDDDYWCMQGKGLEKKLTSGTIGNILEEYLEPDFAKQNYNDGVKKVFDALLSEVGKIYGYTPQKSFSNTLITNEYIDSSREQQNVAKRFEINTFMITLIIFILVIYFIICSAKRHGRPSFFVRRRYRRPPPHDSGFHFGGFYGGFGRPNDFGRPPRGGFGNRGGFGSSNRPPHSGSSNFSRGGSSFGSSSRGSSSRPSSHSSPSRGGGGSSRGGGAGRRH